MATELKAACKAKSRITNAEATVVQKLNQGTNPKSGSNRFRGPFFVTFLGKQKSKEENRILLKL